MSQQSTVPRIELVDDAKYFPQPPADTWQDMRNCNRVGPEVFYPEDSAGVKAAKEICSLCVVKSECLEYALENRIKFGVWGGTSERERKRIFRQRKNAGALAVQPEITA